MTNEQSYEYKDEADREREAGNYVTAGDYYSQAAFEMAGVGMFLRFSSGAELRRLLEACTCYLVGGEKRWCTKRARVGELLAEELAERLFDKPTPSHAFDQAERGVWYEYAGDFRMLGDLGAADAAYERAKETYCEAGDPYAHMAEQPQSVNMAYFRSVAHAADHDMDEVNDVMRTESFSAWVEYKQDHLPSLLDTLVEMGAYPP